MELKRNISNSNALEGHSTFVEESYLQFLSEVREDIGEGHESEHLSADFQDELREIIFRKDLDSYHPLKFYWLNLIDKLVDTLALIEEELNEPSDLIGVFSESDLLGYIVERLEDKAEIETIFEEILEMQELQIVSFYYLHINTQEWQPEGPVSYRPVTELGEGFGHLVLGQQKKHCYVSELTTEAVFPIVGYFPDQGKIQVLVDEKVIEQGFDTLHQTLDGIDVLAGLSESGTPSFDHLDKIKKASQALSQLTPELWSLFKTYTQNIVPIFEEELVSFSMATLPGYSSINMANRDFVDMTDDLLHENGHHFLNALLEGEEEIIFEDDDKIFFSPWRRSLRPIRGLYHAVVTFYWAYRLFKELSLAENLDQFFTKDEVQKIHMRFLEEAELIRQCRKDLEKAYQMEKITDFGKQIIDEVLSEVERDKAIEEKSWTILSEASRSELKEQLQEVSKARLA